MSRTLVTGAAGYIGSHVCKSLLDAGLQVVGFDNLSTGSQARLDRLARHGGGRFAFMHGDIRSAGRLDEAFREYAPARIIHLAGLKDVAESFRMATTYHANNVIGTSTLLAAASRYGVRGIVFSSSAAIYGDTGQYPLAEDSPALPGSPYAEGKLACEELLREWSTTAGTRRNTVIFRYFNPCGWDSFFEGPGEIAMEMGRSLADNVCRVAGRQSEHVEIYGNDYPTRDGTCMRDLVHVADIASAHLDALSRLGVGGRQVETFNLGSGKPVSVLEFVEACRTVGGHPIPHVFRPRRKGDPAVSCSDISRAKAALGWAPEHTLKDICESVLRRGRILLGAMQPSRRTRETAGVAA